MEKTNLVAEVPVCSYFETYLKLMEKIAEHFDILESRILLSDSFMNDYGAEVVDITFIRDWVKEEFGIPIAEEDVSDLFLTVGNLLDYITKR